VTLRLSPDLDRWVSSRDRRSLEELRTDYPTIDIVEV
jgi:hypothetical protein